jgi:hypothetical protein
MSFTAAVIVNNVRDLIPDQIYLDGDPQPMTDGNIRASTMYRWLDDGVRLITSQLGWNLTDWTAMAAKTEQPIYAMNPLFQIVDQAYAKQLRCRVLNQPEADSIYPGRGTQAQSVQAYIFRATDHLDIGFQPVPNFDDPTTTLGAGIDALVTTVPVTSATGFLPFGFVLVEEELIQYQLITGGNLLSCTRGAGGTLAVAHTGGVEVTHCSFWVKGARSPGTITRDTSIVEVPLGWVSLLNHYVLAMARQYQGEYPVSQALLAEFSKATSEIKQVFGGRDFITESAARQTPGTVGVPISRSQMAP